MKRVLLLLSFVMCCVATLFAKADVTLKEWITFQAQEFKCKGLCCMGL